MVSDGVLKILRVMIMLSYFILTPDDNLKAEVYLEEWRGPSGYSPRAHHPLPRHGLLQALTLVRQGGESVRTLTLAQHIECSLHQCPGRGAFVPSALTLRFL